ncbi:MAG: (d)CMP kinase, partial [Candidatus Omnitrophica bacterium]|nr:(d)CMP kinase [Candidatus Omnitrophota bacterium]
WDPRELSDDARCKIAGWRKYFRRNGWLGGIPDGLLRNASVLFSQAEKDLGTGTIREGTRQELLTRAYPVVVLLDPEQIENAKQNPAFKNVRDDWYKKDEIATACKIQTEMTDQYNIISRAQNAARMFVKTIIAEAYRQFQRTSALGFPVYLQLELDRLGQTNVPGPLTKDIVAKVADMIRHRSQKKFIKTYEALPNREYKWFKERFSAAFFKLRQQPLDGRKIIAVDAVAGAGKRTIARELALVMDNFIYVDTGMFYRGLAQQATRLGLTGLEHPEVAKKLLRQCRISWALRPYRLEGRDQEGFEALATINGTPIDEKKLLEDDSVIRKAALLGKHFDVNLKIFQLVREIGEGANAVVVGRNVGTDIFSDAFLKVQLVADLEARADRISFETSAKKRKRALDTIHEQDSSDRKRDHAPLRRAEDAVVLDTTGRSGFENARIIAKLYKDRVRASRRAAGRKDHSRPLPGLPEADAKVVQAELARHDFKAFPMLKETDAAVVLAVRTLRAMGENDMAEELLKMVRANRVRAGPLGGFLATITLIDGNENIVLSSAYPSFNTSLEQALSLIHEIGAVSKYNLTHQQNTEREQKALERIRANIATILDWSAERQVLPRKFNLLWVCGSPDVQTARSAVKVWQKSTSATVLVTGGTGKGNGFSIKDKRAFLTDREYQELTGLLQELEQKKSNRGFWAMMEKRFGIVRGRDKVKEVKREAPRLETLLTGHEKNAKFHELYRIDPEKTIEERVVLRLLDPATREDALLPEAIFYYAVLRANGVPAGKIIVEPLSTTTRENIDFGRHMLALNGVHPETIVLMQQAYNQRRAMATFAGQLPGARAISYGAHLFNGADGLAERDLRVMDNARLAFWMQKALTEAWKCDAYQHGNDQILAPLVIPTEINVAAYELGGLGNDLPKLAENFGGDMIQTLRAVTAWQKELKDKLNQDKTLVQMTTFKDDDHPDGVEYLRVINEKNEYTGEIRPRELCHADGTPHRANSILVFDQDGRVLIQVRKKSKRVYKRARDVSAAGHMGLEREYEDGAVNETSEEVFNTRHTAAIDRSRLIRIGAPGILRFNQQFSDEKGVVKENERSNL